MSKVQESPVTEIFYRFQLLSPRFVCSDHISWACNSLFAFSVTITTQLSVRDKNAMVVPPKVYNELNLAETVRFRVKQIYS